MADRLTCSHKHKFPKWVRPTPRANAVKSSTSFWHSTRQKYENQLSIENYRFSRSPRSLSRNSRSEVYYAFYIFVWNKWDNLISVQVSRMDVIRGTSDIDCVRTALLGTRIWNAKDMGSWWRQFSVTKYPNSFDNKYQYDHISFTECTFIILDKAKYEETNNEVGKSKYSLSTIQSTY